MENLKKFIAEFIGTYVLVVFGCGVAAVTGCTAKADSAYVLTAIAFGLVIVAMAYSIGNISGCHINPAVSLGVFINGGMKAADFVLYVIAQCAGVYNDSIAKSLVIECILTFVFVLAVLGATSKTENAAVAGLVIGGSLTLVHLLGIYFTGTSVNPARSLGPALLAGGDALSNVWVFIVAPLIGGALAALVWIFFKKTADK